MKGNIFIVTAPSGAGKTSLVRALMERTPNAVLSVSHTTREPRPGEIDGEHYHFVTDGEFDRLLKANAFVEHARVFGHWYGTSYKGIDEFLAQDRDVILEIDWQGARQIKRKISEAVGIFILPPSLKELETRLRGRAQDADAVIERRLSEARSELSHFREFDFLVVNDQFDTALADLASIVRAVHLNVQRQAARWSKLVQSFID